MKKIIKILLIPFEHLTEIFIVSAIMAFFTFLELKIFSIPQEYADKIWLGNIILVFIIYFYTKSVGKNK